MANSNDTMTDKRVVTGMFRDRASAECAYNAVTSRGYGKDDVDVVMSKETRDKYYGNDTTGETELGSKAMEGTGTGAAIGGTVGAVLAAIAAIGTSIVLPGIGLIVAGPLAAALVGAGAGGLAGGLVGALVGSGIPEEHATAYETGVKEGGTILRINPRNDEDATFVEQQWRSCGGERIYSNTSREREAGRTMATGTANATASAQPRTANQNEVALPVIEEQLQVGKREVERGGVRVSQSVTETPVEETVTLREEHVNVERRPVNREVSQADMKSGLREGSFDVTTTGEEAVVAKEARVVEEVIVSKDVTQRDETIRDTVRRTDVDVEQMKPERGRGGSAS